MGTISSWKSKNIVVVGDLMLDKYVFGEVERISPEAPIPIVSVQRESFAPGGAANTANNVASLGGKALLVGIVGTDTGRDHLLKSAAERKIETEGVLAVSDRPTIQKIRIIGQKQQLLRIDYDDDTAVSKKTESDLIAKLQNFKHVASLVVSDYAKGVVTETLMEKLKEWSKKENLPLIVDPKPQHKVLYKDVTLITPNKKEAEGMTNRKIQTLDDVVQAGSQLQKELNANILMTLGERGMSLFEKGREPVHLPTDAKEVFDVSGAGDTVVATLSLALSVGASLKDAAVLANHAAGIKVSKFGTAPVSFSEIEKYL